MSSINVGFSRHVVNPPVGIPVLGLYRKRFAKEILDDITVSTVAFDDGVEKALIISVDHLFIDTSLADSFRNAISQRFDLPLEAIFLAATHTHGGPELNPNSEIEIVREYTKEYGQALIDCIADALADLQPAKLSTAIGLANDISFVRRYFMKDGSVRTNPAIGDPDIVGMVNEPNPNVNIIKVERESADNILMVNFGVHPCSLATESVTADFPHFLRQTLEGALPNTKCIFLTAFEGDVGCTKRTPVLGDWDLRSGYKRTEHIGRSLAGSVLQACTLTVPVENTDISYSSSTIRLESFQENDKLEEAKRIWALHKSGRDDEIAATLGKDPGMELTNTIAEAGRRVQLEHGPEYFDFLASAVRIGDIVFAGLPGEPFTEIGLGIQEKSPYQLTVLCCCTNGGSTYFPSSVAYEQGGYESRASTLRKGCAEKLVDGVSTLINSLK